VEPGMKLTSELEEKLDSRSVKSCNPILDYKKFVCFQRKVTFNIENNSMDIEYDILINDEIHFIKPRTCHT
jgi:hypothetical protein